MVHSFNKFIELGLLVYGLSTVWEDTDGCEKKRWALTIYLITVLSYLYGIIMENEINAPNHGKMLSMVLMILTNII